jgi:superfamily II DNA or RNA helicase
MPHPLTRRLSKKTEPRFEEDWARQRRTAADILERLQIREGVILADQVGMGKTYVALAVAVNQILSTAELGRVVIFAPAAVADKWVREWRKFSESLLEPGTGIRCVDTPIRSGEELLKKLDDQTEKRDHVIVVTHTALTTTLKDTFIQLALIYYATRYIRSGHELRKRVAKWSTGMSGLIRDREFTPDRVANLLDTAPSKWREAWQRLVGEDLPDDPVPETLEAAARQLNLNDLRTTLEELPINTSADIEQRLEKARKALAEATQATWKGLLSSIELDLPLLIVDEAHRLKNPHTKIGMLFAERSNDTNAGALRGLFRRMLFLTATPFELGHTELIEVLSRMGAVRTLEPPPARPLKDRLDDLGKVLTTAQATALALDEAWGRLREGDLAVFEVWDPAAPAPTDATAASREAWELARLAVRARRQMHEALRPWVIRHERPHRRDYHPGAAITPNAGNTSGGIMIPDSAALPFLLAARAQSVALDKKSARPLFAYGIASSYDAFRRIGSDEHDRRDSDLPPDERGGAADTSTPKYSMVSESVDWYRQEIDQALAESVARDGHPKVSATVERALKFWLDGEKCLIFCYYIRTGEAVERALTTGVEMRILKQASAALGTRSDDETRRELERLSDSIFRRDASSYERIRQRLTDALTEAGGGHNDVLDLVADAAIRHLRTPSYLVRYTPLGTGMTDEDVWEGLHGNNARGIALIDRWRQFAERLAKARKQIEIVHRSDEHDSEFNRIRAALLGASTEDDQAARRGASLSPVRRAHGGTDRDVRERVIALFNTPLSPDLLVASSVMGEGIDLHQECRFVIHHDLDWNPGVLEQRTGRLDRIGALAERQGKRIEVYEPYLAGTHDEKMYRVVKDRAQWFHIVMGRSTGSDEYGTDIEESRLPLHERIRAALEMDLRSPDRKHEC